MPQYATTTRATLRQRVRERLLSTFWTDIELNATINEALRIWNVCTGFQRNIYTGITFGANTFGYSVASTIGSNAMFILRIDQSGTTPLSPVTLKELGDLDINWVTRTATAPSNWMQLGQASVYLYPTLTQPQSGVSVYTLDLFQIPTADGDFIQLGEEDIQYIVDYCVFSSHLKEGGKEATDAVALLKGFLQQAAKYNAKILQTSIYKRVMGLMSQPQTRMNQLEHPTVR